MVNGACQARKKVYFDVAERQNETSDPTLTPIPLDPLKPGDVGPVVSPARPAP